MSIRVSNTAHALDAGLRAPVEHHRPAPVMRIVRSSYMNAACSIPVLALATILAGCSRPAAVPQSVRPMLQRIAGVDVNMHNYPSYAEYHDRVYARINYAIHPLSSASELK